MTLKKDLKEANEDKAHLQDMCYKLMKENIRLNKIIKELKEQKNNLIGDNLALKIKLSRQEKRNKT